MFLSTKVSFIPKWSTVKYRHQILQLWCVRVCVCVCVCVRARYCDAPTHTDNTNNMYFESNPVPDTHLSCSGHEPRLPGWKSLLRACEDAGDAIRFCQQWSINHGETESRQQARQATRQPRWFGKYREGGGVAESHSREDQVTEFPGWGLDDRGVVVANKNGSSERGGQETETRECYGYDRLCVRPLDELGWNFVTSCGPSFLH